MNLEEAEPLLLDFQLYAYETPYWYRVELIDWELVWSSYLRYDYFEQDGYYFRNL